MELVVGASLATMKSLLGKLGTLLASEYALVRGVRDDIQYINDELGSMQAFLINLSASGGTRDHDAQTKDWMKQIRDVAYDVEDCLDNFMRRLPDGPQGGGCITEIHLRIHELWTCSPRRDIAAKIAALKFRAQQIGERRVRYGVKNPELLGDDVRPTGFDAAEDQLAKTQLVATKEPVGMDEYKELHDWVLKDMNSGVLYISGFGGLGKTTIAKGLYAKYGHAFDCRATVVVSQGSDLKPILRDILRQVKLQTNNQVQQVTSGAGASSPGRCECLKVKLPPAKLWPCFQNQGNSNSEGSSEKHEVAGRHDNEQQNNSVHDGDGGGNSPKENNPLMQRARSHILQSSSNSDQGNQDEKKNLMASFTDTFSQLVECAGYGKKHGRSEHDELVEELKKHLGENRYFLLIDDVWSATMWRDIKNCLPLGKDGSKIIVTTRFQAVANASNHNQEMDKVHQLDVLSHKDAAKLFEEVVSESRSTKAGQWKKSEKPPDKIWELCGGMPLAIVTMAGHVACNPHKHRKKWNDVCKSLFPETSDTHFRKSDSLNPQVVTKILNYCYNDLPADIKTCSLYLSIFPKGSRISRKRLTRRWIAEGFVTEKQGLSEEDVAEAYFNHLVRRRIIRPVGHSGNGKVKTCQVHDMVLEYIVSKSSEENFTTVIGGHWLVPMHSNKVRRLSLQSIDSIHAKAVRKRNLSHLRSLSVFGSLIELPSHSFKIGLVQVLDLEGCMGFKKKHIKEISKMPLLKYLSLRNTDIDKFPPNIEKLQYLETLDIRETIVEELPDSVGKLIRLTNVLGGDKTMRKALKLPKEIKKETMGKLHILSGIEFTEGSSVLANPHDFTRLKKLVIYKLIRSAQISRAGTDKGMPYQDLLSAIQYLGGYSLRSLTIDDECSDFFESFDKISTPPKFLQALELSGRLLKLPSWVGDLNDLNKLTLSVMALRTDTFEVLKRLRSLFSLTFSLHHTEELHAHLVAILEKNKLCSDGVIVIPKDEFDGLKLLRFNAPILPRLCFSENAMPKLERLELRFRMLEGLIGMDNLQSLQEVHLIVNDKAGDTTKLIVGDLVSAAEKFARKPRVIRDKYYDWSK